MPALALKAGNAEEWERDLSWLSAYPSQERNAREPAKTMRELTCDFGHRSEEIAWTMRQRDRRRESWLKSSGFFKVVGQCFVCSMARVAATVFSLEF